MLGQWNAAALQKHPTITNLDAPAIPDVSVTVVGPPTENECCDAKEASVPLILKPAMAPVIEVVTILNPEIHWQWMRRQAIDSKERSSLNYDPSNKKKKGDERNLWTAALAPSDDSRRWKSNFELLLAYQRRHGHCRIPDGETTEWPVDQHKKLLRWVCDQHTQYRNVLTGQGNTVPTLTRERIELLDSIGFEWKGPKQMRKCGRASDDQIWNQKLELLRAFQREHGHCIVPRNHVTAGSVNLGSWVACQRMYKKQFDKGLSSCGGITQERINKLDSIGFEWRVHGDDSTSWKDKFALLRSFQREHGHCIVPHNYVTAGSVNLGLWVANQRMFKKKFDKGLSSCCITQARIDKLISIGFEWTIRGDDKSWNDKFELLRAFQREHGHCNVPRNYSTAGSVNLGFWVSHQRMYKKQYDKGLTNCCITEERIDTLNSIGFG